MECDDMTFVVVVAVVSPVPTDPDPAQQLL
jgi:hypothetical protein